MDIQFAKKKKNYLGRNKKNKINCGGWRVKLGEKGQKKFYDFYFPF